MGFTVGSTPYSLFDADAQFAADADKFLEYARRKLGDPVIAIHASSSEYYGAFEEATSEYSSWVNSYQAKSVLAQFLGSPTGSLSGSEQTFTARLIEFQKKMAEPYGEEAGLNGPHPVFSGSLTLQNGVQKYDLQYELQNNGFLPGNLSGSRIVLKDLYHFNPLAVFRFFGTTSVLNFLATEFNFNSYTPETIFYLLPVWEDVLRGEMFKTSNRVRRSNYSYELHNNVLTVYPVPNDTLQLHMTFMTPPDPTVPANAQEAKSRAGVSNMSNIPFGNVVYSKLNSMGKNWIKRMAFAFIKETEGHIRGKFSTVPIPNGDVTLDGPQLIADAKQEQNDLREELKAFLEETSYDRLAAREAERIQAVKSDLANVPMLIYVG